MDSKQVINAKLKKLAKKYLDLYEIEDLQIGGHCGICGKWIPDKIYEKVWAVGICKEHIQLK